MLDLVKHETQRIESRFLEPACGNGNFLKEILSRKLAAVKVHYGKEVSTYQYNALITLSSLYGVDILADNAEACRFRLLSVFTQAYEALFKKPMPQDYQASVEEVLKKNIIVGDALTLKQPSGKPIVFCEWSPFNGVQIIRRDFSFKELIQCAPPKEGTLFSDLGENAYIPTPIKEYPPIHYLRLSDVEKL